MTAPGNDAKLTPSRLARRAIVYVRQSTQKQVEYNRESRELQYALAERARALGWKRVDVIDDDLGASAGLAAAPRGGFERMLAAVALGEVGIVISREASRLSRTDRDWCRLCEVCQIFDTLIGDGERCYDLSSLDDQLVLGIKGTLSVVELKVLRQRLLAGTYHKASRGELHRTLAPGYVLDALGNLVKDPNQRVQEAIALVFSAFRETGTVRQTYQWFHHHHIELPVNQYRGNPSGKPRIVFQLPTLGFLSSVLHNPIYAGAYVYGRRPQEIRVVEGALTKRQRSPVAPEQARVFLRDHHEGYLDWASYQENLRMMRSNTRRWDHDQSAGLARRGTGLLAGLLRCGQCGRKLHVRYWGKSGTSARYLCKGDYEAGGQYCLGFGGRGADRRLAEEVLHVVSPLGIEASLEAMRQVEEAHASRRALLLKQLAQVEYEAERAFEQYDRVDARNRLVASELESRWNEKLREVEAVKCTIAQLDETTRPLSEAERADLSSLGGHFRDVWQSPSCPPELKKKIVRTVVEEIVVSEEPAGTLRFIVHWKGGVHTRFEMPRPPSAIESRTAEGDIDIIRRLAQRYGDDQIAGVLNRLGRRTGKGNRWNEHRVASARKSQGIAGQARTKLAPEILSLSAAAEHAGVSDTAIRRLVEAGLLPCEQLAPYAPWEIRRADLEAEPVHRVIEHLRRTGKLVPGGSAGSQGHLFPEKSGEVKGQVSWVLM
jgi:DNA invertase Pin-like site-specific DNA recombinase